MKIQMTNAGQWTLTIPRNLVHALGFKRGDDFQVIINKGGNLEFIKIIGVPIVK
jgi:antitoxin component of MazEF toxin-antitoxin module